MTSQSGAIPWLKPGRFAFWLFAAAVLFMVLFPIAMILWASVWSGTPGAPGEFTLAPFKSVLLDTGTWQALFNTLLVASCTMVLGVGLGTLLSFANLRTNMPGRSIFSKFNLLPYFITPLIAAISWKLLFGNAGWLNRILGTLGMGALFSTESLPGVILVLTLWSIPIAYLFTSGSFINMDPALEDAARSCGATPAQTGLRITLPLAANSIFISAIALFIIAAEAFAVPLVLGGGRLNLLTTRIFVMMESYPVQYGAASALSILFFMAALLFRWVQLRLTAAKSYTTVSGKGFRPRDLELGPWARWSLFAFNTLYLLLGAVLPLIMLVLVSFQSFWIGTFNPDLFTLENWQTVFGLDLFDRALINSLLLSGGGATLGIIIALIINYTSMRGGFRFKNLLVNAAMIPWSLPGIVLAVGLLWGWIWIPLPIYGTIWILLIAYLTRFLTYGIENVRSVLLQLGLDLENSARVCGAGWLTTVRKISIPILAPGLIAGWIMMFIVFFRELDTSILLYSAGSEVLSVAVFILQQEGSYGISAAVGLIQTGIVFTAVLLLNLVTKSFGPGQWARAK
jgi:iron(III) transport system permease protein